MSFKLGFQGEIQYKVGGIAGEGDWLPAPTTRENTLDLTAGEADGSSRAGGGFTATVPSLISASIGFDAIWDATNAAIIALRTAFLTRATIGLRVLDSSAPGGQGLQADCAIFGFSRPEPLQDLMVVNVVAKPTISATNPSWHTVPEPDPEP